MPSTRDQADHAVNTSTGLYEFRYAGAKTEVYSRSLIASHTYSPFQRLHAHCLCHINMFTPSAGNACGRELKAFYKQKPTSY